MNATGNLLLDDLVDNQPVGRVTVLLGMIALLVMVSDGFDLAAMGLIAPDLLKEWHLAPEHLVGAFTAGIVGMMVGGPLLGVAGDRYGRKRTMQAGLVLIGLVTLATTLIHSVSQLVVLRFLTGVGLGGVVPNVIALVAELAPRQHRGRMVVIATTGMVLGMSLCGMVSAALVPRFGWHALMLVGGVIPMVIALVAGWLPESVKYLAAKGGRDDDILSIVRRLRPDLMLDESSRIVSPPHRAKEKGAAVGLILSGELRIVSPLLWFILASTQLASFFAVTWLPTLLEGVGMTTSQAGVHTSLFSLGGVAGALLLVLVVDRLGALPMFGLLLLAGPSFALILLPGVSGVAHVAVIALAGFAILGGQQAVMTLIGLVYPTALRSSGSGTAYSIGRIGSVSAPMLGGLLFQMHVEPRHFLLLPALLLFAGALAAGALVILVKRKFGGFQPGEFSVE